MFDKVYITKNLKGIAVVCDLCSKYRSMGLVYGSPGTGKTTALEYWLKKRNDAIYVEVPSESWTGRILLTETIYELGSSKSKGNTWDLEKYVTILLKEKNIKCFIIDQANYLKVRSLNILKSICKSANVGLIIAGTLQLKETLISGKVKYELDQYYSRLDYTYKTEGINKKNIIWFMDKLNIEKDINYDKIINEILIRAKEIGQMRTMIIILKRAVELKEMNKCDKINYLHFSRSMEHLIKH